MCVFSAGGGGGGNDAAAQQRADEEARQGRINTGMDKINNLFTGYDDNFYNTKGTEYNNYFTPQVENQYSNAKDKLLYSQANTGNVGGSASNYANSQLAKEYSQYLQQVQSGSQDYINNAKSQVAGVRSNLVGQLQSSADPSSITPDALNQISIQNVSSMSPLTGLFNDLVSTYGNYNANTALTGNTNSINSSVNSLFGNNGSSSKSSKYITG